MSIQTICDLIERTRAVKSEDDFDNLEELHRQALKELTSSFRTGKEILTRGMPEEKVVQFLRSMQYMTASAQAASGEVDMLLVNKNSIEEYTQTIVLSVIGILYEEGII